MIGEILIFRDVFWIHKLSQRALFALITFLSDKSDQCQRDGAIILPYQKVIKIFLQKSQKSDSSETQICLGSSEPFLNLPSKDLLNYVENITPPKTKSTF